MNEEKLRKVIERLEKEMKEKNITDDEERETYYRIHLMKYMSTGVIKEDAKRGKYHNCKKQLLFQGYSEREAEIACAKWLVDEFVQFDPKPNNIDLMFGTDTKKDKECLNKKISIFAHEHPEWSHDKVVAAAHGYCGLSKKDDAIELSEVIQRSKSLSFL